MKKILFILLTGILLLNNQQLNSQPPCGVFQEVHNSPFGAGSGPNSFAFSPVTATNHVFAAVANLQSASISAYMVNESTGLLTQVSGSPFPAGLSPSSVEFSPLIPTNILYAAVASFGTNSIEMYSVDPTTGVFTLVNTTSTGTTAPVWAVFSPLTTTNALYLVAVVGDTASTGHIIAYSVNTGTGALTAVANSAIGAENFPTIQIATSPFIAPNTFYIATTNANTTSINVYSFNTGTNTLTAVAGSPFAAGNDAVATAFSPLVGGLLFAAATNFASNTVSVYTVNTGSGVFTQLADSPFPTGNGPISVEFSPVVDSNLYAAVVNQQAATVSAYSVDPITGTFTSVGAAVGTGSLPGSIAFSPLIGTNILFAGVSNFFSSNASVFSVDVGPIANNGTLAACSGQPTPGTLTATPSGISTITSFTIITGPSHGIITPPTASGAFTYTANVGFMGSDSFTFTATDSNGCTSNTATVSITVRQSPVAISSSFAICGNKQFSSILQATSSSGASIISFAIVTPPAHGTISLIPSSGAFTYTPNQGFSGADFFTFTATDSNGCTSAPTIVIITVSSIPVITIAVNPTAIVLGQSAVLTATPLGGTPPYQIIWSDGVIESNVFSAITRTVSPQVTTTYSATVIDAQGCRSDPSNRVKLCILTGSALSNAIFLKYCGCR